MCLFPQLILNKKYLPTRKNNYNPPPLEDIRLKYVPVGCGNCIECRKQKANEWRIRLIEELDVRKYAYFVTLTFSNENLQQLMQNYKLTENNALATKAVRLFLERWRKEHKKSLKHWLVTELGHENTERIHLHGIIFNDTPFTTDYLEKKWAYGNIYVGDFCNIKTINYIIKYVTKVDNDHKNYKQIILCSKGIGANFRKNILQKRRLQFKGKDTQEFYRHRDGTKVNLPIYYRNFFFSEEEREKLWIMKIEEDTRYVMGTKIENFSSDKGQKLYRTILKNARRINKEAGYGDYTHEWKKLDYNTTVQMINKANRNKTRAYKGAK